MFKNSTLLKGLTALLFSVNLSVTMPALAQDKAAETPAATSAASAPVAPPMPDMVKKEEVDNPYGIGAIWSQGDFVAKSTLIIMIIMSIIFM